MLAKVGSDAASDQDAADRLGHTNPETARRHYRRKPIRIIPMTRAK